MFIRLHDHKRTHQLFISVLFKYTNELLMTCFKLCICNTKVNYTYVNVIQKYQSSVVSIPCDEDTACLMSNLK